MGIVIREYQTEDVTAAITIWNQVVEDGVAFPQEENLTEETGDAFFKEQTYTGIAVNTDNNEIVGLYILHPNNVGRCGHICNASYAVRRDLRGEHIGEKLVLDLSCRRKDGKYYIVTDRWQKFTDIEMNSQTLEMFSEYCDEFLIHAVDTEGKAKGIEPQIAKIMGEYCTIPSTYAGGISSFDDLDTLKELGRGKIDFTIGSALDIFGGNISFEKVAAYGK